MHSLLDFIICLSSFEFELGLIEFCTFKLSFSSCWAPALWSGSWLFSFVSAQKIGAGGKEPFRVLAIACPTYRHQNAQEFELNCHQTACAAVSGMGLPKRRALCLGLLKIGPAWVRQRDRDKDGAYYSGWSAFQVGLLGTTTKWSPALHEHLETDTGSGLLSSPRQVTSPSIATGTKSRLVRKTHRLIAVAGQNWFRHKTDVLCQAQRALVARGNVWKNRGSLMNQV